MVLESNHRKSQLMSVALILTGSLLLFLLRSRVPLDSNELAAQYMGYLLIFIGGSALVMNERIKLEFRKESGLVLFSCTSIRGTKNEAIAYSNIDHVAISRIGRPRNRTVFYFLHLGLKSGERLPTGIFFSSAESAQTEANRIAELIGCKSQQIATAGDHRFSEFIIAFVIGLLSYVVYYRLTVGPPCKAMWFGTAPPVIIMLSTWIALTILRTRSFMKKGKR